MKKYLNKNLWREIIINFLFFFSLEVIFRVIENYEIISYSTLRIAMFCFLFSAILQLILCTSKNSKNRQTIFEIILGIASLYAFIQIGLKGFVGMYMSLGTTSQAGAVTSFIFNFFKSYRFLDFMIWIPFILFVVYKRIPQKWSNDIKNHNSKMELIGVVIGLCAIAIGYHYSLELEFMQNDIQLIPNKILFKNPSNSAIAVNQFGISTYALLDIKQLFFRGTNQTFELEPLQEQNENHGISNEIWNQLIKEEKSSEIKTLHQYFAGRNVTTNNEYTGYFKGKNIIFVLMETAGDILNNEEYFPNFAKMKKNGWYFENHYSPRQACATADNEFSGLTSLYAVQNKCTGNTYPKNTYFQSAFNLFRTADYKATSYHDYLDEFYDRSVYHLTLGSEKYYDAESLGIDMKRYINPNWPDDVEFIEKAIPYITSEKPFMAWMTTVTAHFPYIYESETGDMYLEKFKDTKYSLEVQRYLSKLKRTDDALGKLMDLLEEKNILNDTVIVAYGDHYAYGLSKEMNQEMYDYDIEEFHEIDRTPLIIYNPGIEGKVFSQKTSYINILPTIANLFELEYDSRLYFGEDLLDKNYSGRVIFADNSWEDNIARYYVDTGTLEYLGKEKYSSEELRKINQEVYYKKQMSKLAIENNYFDILQKELEEKKKEE